MKDTAMGGNVPAPFQASAPFKLNGTPTTLAAALAAQSLWNVPPQISGTPNVANPLLCSPGSLSGAATAFSYQWQVNGANVAGATAPAYTPVSTDLGKSVSCLVTATLTSGLVTNATPPVTIVAPSTSSSFNIYTGSQFANWTSGADNLSASPVTAPDGTATATRILSNTGNSGHALNYVVTRSATAQSYVIELWVRPYGLDVGLYVDDNTSSNRVTQIFNVTTGTLGTSVISGSGVNGAQAHIVAAPNGWYRLTFTFRVSAAITSLRTSIRLISAGSDTFAGTGTTGVDAWNPRLISQVPPVALQSIPGGQPFILDTDMATDIDDPVALRLFMTLAAKGVINPLAVVVDSSVPTAAPAVRAMIAYSASTLSAPSLLNIPIGAYKGNDQAAYSPFTPLVVSSFGLPNETRASYPDALPVVRQALANATDGTVVYAAIGGNAILQQLLMSPPDGYSNLSGYDLVKRKVRRLVVVGGDNPSGSEYNFTQAPGATAYFAANWPTEILAVSYTQGASVQTAMPFVESTSTSPYALAFNNGPNGYLSTRSGVTALTITAAGSGGTADGNYPLIFSGGGMVGVSGDFTVSGGKVTAVHLSAPGEGTSAPTVTATAPGLTGATITATFGTWQGRASWDPLAVYLGVVGADGVTYTMADPPGTNVVDPTTGANVFVPEQPFQGRWQYINRLSSTLVTAGTLMKLYW